jgi:hypothetical protein
MKARVSVGTLFVLCATAVGLVAQPSDPQPSDLSRVWDDYRSGGGNRGADAGTRGAAQEGELRDRQDRLERSQERGAAFRDAAGTGIEWLDWGINTARDLNDLRESYEALTRDDPTLEPDYRPPGTPDVPSSCEGNEGCGDCYRQALADLNRIRTLLERLRAIYANTKNFADKAMAFGDSASGIHGVSGLAWQQEKRRIEREVATLQQSYDAKYRELLPGVERALRRIGECEARHFNNPDWYDRYGFIYYTFLSDRYKRAD